MWEGTPGIDSLLRNPDNLREVKSVRDAIRSLLREARALDAESDVADPSCEADIRRYYLLVCERIIGGQKRELAELDRACLEQVPGFKINPADFTAVAAELRSRSAADLDAILPELLRRKARADARIHDPCDSIIRHIETVAKSTGEVYGDKHRKRASSTRIGLQLRSLADTEREQEAERANRRMPVPPRTA